MTMRFSNGLWRGLAAWVVFVGSFLSPTTEAGAWVEGFEGDLSTWIDNTFDTSQGQTSTSDRDGITIETTASWAIGGSKSLHFRYANNHDDGQPSGCMDGIYGPQPDGTPDGLQIGCGPFISRVIPSDARLDHAVGFWYRLSPGFITAPSPTKIFQMPQNNESLWGILPVMGTDRYIKINSYQCINGVRDVQLHNTPFVMSNDGTAVHLEFREKIATGTNADGLIQFWVNGVLQFQATGIRHRCNVGDIREVDQLRLYKERGLGDTWYDNVSVVNGLQAPTLGVDTVPPSQVSGLTATAGQNQVQLSWGAATDNVGVTTYQIEQCVGAGCNANFVFVQSVSAPTTQFTVLALTTGTAYGFRVRARDAAGNFGNYSTTTYATPATPPSGQAFSFAQQFSGVQGQNQWSYLTANGSALTYEASTATWKGNEAYQWIWASRMHPGGVEGTMLRWTAPGSGTVSITGSVQDTHTTCGDGVILEIKKGATVLYTKTIGPGDGAAYMYSVNTAVTGGGAIDFLVSPRSGNDCDSTLVNPVISFAPTQSGSTTYEFATQFSGVQGQNGWSYFDAIGNALTFDSSANIWKGSEAYQWIWASRIHPGNFAGSMLRWTAPGSGTVNITGAVQDDHTTCGDGVILEIKKGGSVLYTKTIGTNDGNVYSYSVTTSVVSGGTIDFVVGPRDGNDCDATRLTPTISFTP